MPRFEWKNKMLKGNHKLRSRKKVEFYEIKKSKIYVIS